MVSISPEVLKEIKSLIRILFFKIDLCDFAEHLSTVVIISPNLIALVPTESHLDCDPLV